MEKLPDISNIQLAELLSSYICHEIISPVGAIINGLELIDEDKKQDMQEAAMDLIRFSASNASSKLQFARIAFGSMSSLETKLDIKEPKTIAYNYFENEKRIKLFWENKQTVISKNRLKLLFNLLLTALSALPRGGNIDLVIDEENCGEKFIITCSGKITRIPTVFNQLLNGSFNKELDSRAVQPFYTLKIAEYLNLTVSIQILENDVVLTAY